MRRACFALVCLVAALATVGAVRAETAAEFAAELERLGFTPVPGQERLEVRYENEGGSGSNVIGFLPATPGEAAEDTGAILLGTRFYPEAELPGPSFFPGAILPAAKRIAEANRRHPVIVALWSGQTGAESVLPSERLLASINLVGGRPAPKYQLDVEGCGTSPVWRGLVERANVPVGFDIHIEDAPPPVLNDQRVPYEPSGVPAVTLSAGDDHAMSSEDAARQEERLAHFAALLVRRLDALESPPEYVDYSAEQGKPKLAKQKPYTGTIPDYMAEVEGVRLSGVMEGGPAEAAGLAEGDVIVEFAGKKIADIYGYRDALDTVEVGRPIQVVFVRDGERREVTVVPTARP